MKSDFFIKNMKLEVSNIEIIIFIFQISNMKCDGQGQRAEATWGRAT